MLTDSQGSKSNSHVVVYFHIAAATLTFLSIIGSDIFVRVSRRLQPSSQPNSQQPSSTNASTVIVNTIPFSTLNLSIALAVVVNIISAILGVWLVNGLQASMILAGLVVTNKNVRKHLRLRLRQNMDSLTIGRSNQVQPIGQGQGQGQGQDLRQNLDSATRNRVEPVVSIALVPVRDFRGFR